MPSIKFDTTVETSNVVSGFKDIQNAIQQTADRATSSGTALDASMQTGANSVQALKQRLQSLNQTLSEQKALVEEQKAYVQQSALALSTAKSAYKEVAEAKGEYAATISEESAELKAVQKAHEEDTLVLRGYNLEVSKTKLAIAETVSQLKQMGAGSSKEADAFQQIIDKIEIWKTKLQDVQVLNDKFNAQNASVQSLSQSISDLSQNSTDYSNKAQALLTEINELSAALRLSGDGLNAADKAQGIDLLKQKITEYGQAVTESSASVQAAFTLQQQVVQSLEQTINSLQADLQSASAAGNSAAVNAIQGQIDSLNKELVVARGNLASLQQQAESATQAMDGVASVQEKLSQGLNRGGSFFGDIIDEATLIKDKVSSAFESLSNSVSTKLEPIKNKLQEVGQSVSTAFSNLSEKIGLDRLGNKLAEYKQKVEDVATGHGKFQQSLSNMKTALNGLPIPLGNVITSVGNVTKALWAMCATPIGAAIAAIVVGLRAMYSWFTKSAEGQKAFTALSAYFGSLMSSITDIVVIFGKYLYHAFADANAPLNAFAKAVIVTFKSAIKTVSKLVGGLGTTLRGIFTLDWSTFKSGMLDMGEGLASAVGTVLNAVGAQIKGVTGSLKLLYKATTDDKLGKELGNAFSSMADKASNSKNLALQELNANIELGKAKEKEAAMEVTIAEEMDKVYKLTGKAKEEQIKKLKALKQEKYDAIISAQEKLYKVQQERNKLHTVSLGDLKQERDLHISLLTTQAQRVSSIRMLTRMETMNENKMASAAKSAAKKAEQEAKKAEQKAKKGLQQENAQTSAQAKEDELIRKNTAARVKAAQDIEDAVTDARLNAMKDGEEKIIEERNRELQKELAQNEAKRVAAVEAERQRQKAEFEASEAVKKSSSNSYKVQSWDDSMLDNSFIEAINEQYKKIDDYIVQKVNQEEKDKELQSMRDYLKEYGSLYQQKQAIAEEYEEKIAKAQTEGEKKTLQQEKKKALANFDYESISMGIDWKGLMSGVGNMSKEMLKPMLEKLDAYTNMDKFQQADTQTQQKVVELMQEIRTYLGTDQNATWQNLAASITSFNQSVAEYQMAVDKEKSAQANLSQAKNDLKSGKITQDAFDKIKKSSDDASQAVVDAKNKMNTFGIKLNSATEAVTNYTSGLTAALNKLGTWKGNEGFSEVQNAVKAIDNAKGALDEALSAMKDGKTKDFGKTVSNGVGVALQKVGYTVEGVLSKGMGSIVGFIAQIPKLILNLASSIKSFVTGILDSFTQLIQLEWLSDLVVSITNAVGNLIDAIFDLPENLYKALEGIVVEGVGGMLDTLVGRLGNVLSLGALSSDGPSSWFTNSNAEKVQKTIDRLTDRNELLQQSIEDLTDAMENSYGSKATSYYEQAYKNQQETNQNYLDIAKAQASYHASHGSWNRYWGGFGSDEMDWIKKNVKSDFNGDLFSLSPEEMKLLRGNVAIWEHIENTGKGNYGGRLTEKLNDYIDQAGKLDELSDKLKVSLTQISFDSMKDSFVSDLMDMSKSAQDFADDFAEMMQKALLSYSMEDLINGDLKKLYDDWAKAIKDNDGKLTETDIEAFNKRYDDIVQEGLKRRDDWAKVTGYTGSSSSSQTATNGGWASMGQDTADELNGRFTALQIAGESIAQNMTTTISQMESIVTLGISTNGAVLEIRNMMIMTNSYLEDIVKYSKLTYNEFGTKLDDMNRRLKDI